MRSPTPRGDHRFLRKTLFTGLVIALSGTAIEAANTGFKQTVKIPADPASTVHWLALPLFYAPGDVGTAGVVDAEDLCQDVDAEGISAVLRWEEASATFVEHTCGDESPFPLNQGEGYAVRVLPDWTVDSHLAGGHDEDFAYSIPASGGSQLSWLSVPYHLRVPGKTGDPTVSAEDLCQQIGSSEVTAILRWSEEAGAYEAYACGSSFQEPFPIVRGTAYGVINRGEELIEWQPLHH